MPSIMTAADDHFARVGAALDRCRERVASDLQLDHRLPECAREALALSEALQPVDGITIRLGNGTGAGC